MTDKILPVQIFFGFLLVFKVDKINGVFFGVFNKRDVMINVFRHLKGKWRFIYRLRDFNLSVEKDKKGNERKVDCLAG